MRRFPSVTTQKSQTKHDDEHETGEETNNNSYSQFLHLYYIIT